MNNGQRKVTKLIATFERTLPTDFTNVIWKPWINCDPADELLANMAAYQHVRFRGGLGDADKLEVFVCIRDSMDMPCTVDCTQFTFHRK